MVLGVVKLYVYSVTAVLLGHLRRLKVGVVAKKFRALRAQLNLQPHHTKNPRSTPAQGNNNTLYIVINIIIQHLVFLCLLYGYIFLLACFVL